MINQTRKQNLTLKPAALRIFDACGFIDITNTNKYPDTPLPINAALSVQSKQAQRVGHITLNVMAFFKTPADR